MILSNTSPWLVECTIESLLKVFHLSTLQPRYNDKLMKGFEIMSRYTRYTRKNIQNLNACVRWWCWLWYSDRNIEAVIIYNAIVSRKNFTYVQSILG